MNDDVIDNISVNFFWLVVEPYHWNWHEQEFLEVEVKGTFQIRSQLQRLVLL